MGPAPNTATVSPSCTAANFRECTATARGSTVVANSQRHFFGDGEQIVRRQIHELAEKARLSGVAEKSNVGADVVATAAAELAVVAVEGRFQGGAVTGGPSGDTRAGLYHGAGGFVTQHHGVGAGRVADGAFGIGVQIGPADAHGIHADLYLTGCGFFERLFHQAEFAGGNQFGYEHGGYAAIVE